MEAQYTKVYVMWNISSQKEVCSNKSLKKIDLKQQLKANLKEIEEEQKQNPKLEGMNNKDQSINK
jgi:hypothetical protein